MGSNLGYLRAKRTIKIVEFILMIFVFIIVFQTIQLLFSNGKDHSFLDVLDFIFNSVSEGMAEDINTTILDVVNLVITNIFYIVVAITVFRLYDTTIIENKTSSTLFSTFVAVSIINSIIFIVVVFNQLYTMNINILVITIFTQFLFVVILKEIIFLIFRKYTKKEVAVFGPKEEVEVLAKKFYVDNTKRLRLRYVLYENDQQIKKKTIAKLKGIEEIYISPSSLAVNKNILIEHCTNNRYITYNLIPKIYEIAIINSKKTFIDDLMSFEVSSLHLSMTQRVYKRTTDLLIAVPVFILTLPLLLIAMLMIKIEDGGKIFFLQERMTRNGKVFKVYKLRSMTEKSSKKTDRFQKTQANDARVTKTGKIIRATRIDELPQIINVLKGEMSMIGPRALAVSEYNECVAQNPKFKYRLNIKAGVTGYAQTMGKYDTSRDDKLRFDLLYIRKIGLVTDFKIVLYTVRTVLDRTSTRGVSTSQALEDILHSLDIAYTKSDDFIQMRGRDKDEK